MNSFLTMMQEQISWNAAKYEEDWKDYEKYEI